MISVKDISRLDQLKALAEVRDSGRIFWPQFCEQMQNFLSVSDFFVFIQQDDNLRRIAGGKAEETTPDEHWLALTRAALHQNKPIIHKTHGLRVAQKVAVKGESAEIILVAGWSDAEVSLEAERLFKFRIGAQIPDVYQKNRTMEHAREDVIRLAYILELVAKLQQKRHFSEASLECCNLLAGRMEASQVAFGWLENGHLVLKAVSHQPQLVRDSHFALQLEQLMSETAAYEQEIHLSSSQKGSSQQGSTPFEQADEYPAHLEYLTNKERPVSVVSVPMHLDGQVVGVLFLEREQKAFQESELWQLRLFADHLSYQFQGLHQELRSFWQKCRHGWKAFKQRVFVQKSPVDLALFSSLVLLPIILLSLQWQYRIDANFLLKTDTLKVVSSPFDGFLTRSDVRVGDQITAGQTIVELDIRELLLEQSAAVADLQRQQREADKARATGALADMRIALAQVEQARSKLDMIGFRIQSSKLQAPFDSILVEGDIDQMSGSPVRQGDILLKLASLNALYFELEADEKVIQELSPGMMAEISFVTRPEEHFMVSLEKIVPVAHFKDGVNLFQIRASFAETVPDWWRPGMSGLAKVDAGTRSGFWLLFHNLLDSLRMRFFW